MAIDVACSGCGHAWRAGDAARGMRMPCPKCQASVTIGRAAIQPGASPRTVGAPARSAPAPAPPPAATPRPRMARGSTFVPAETRQPFALDRSMFTTWLRMRGIPDGRLIEVIDLASQLLLRTGGDLGETAIERACHRALDEGKDARFVAQLQQVAATLSRFRADVASLRR